MSWDDAEVRANRDISWNVQAPLKKPTKIIRKPSWDARNYR